MTTMYLCKPTTSDNIDSLEKAHFEYANLVEHLRQHKVTIEYVEQLHDVNDMMLTARAGLLQQWSTTAVLANVSVPEHHYWTSKLSDVGFDVHSMTYSFGGQRDAHFSHDSEHLWVGTGHTTEQRAVNELVSIFDFSNVHSLRLVKPEYDHLDTCFCPLPNNKVMLYSPAFDFDSLQEIYSVYHPDDIIDACKKDAESMSCNAIVVYDDIFIHNPSWYLIDELYTHGLNVVTTPMSQYVRKGCSVRSCVLIEQ